MRGPQGAALRIVGVMRDVTPQKAVEAEARQLEQQLLRAQRLESVGRLAGGIAHDFNNLLTVISGYADLAMRELGPAGPARAQITEIRRAAERATELTRHLLAFSRQQVLEPRVFDLNAVLAEIEKLLVRLIGEDIELAILPCARRATVKADRSQVEQVVINLAVNARDAMPKGGKLTITTSVVHLENEDRKGELSDLGPGDYVTLAVRDTGCGIAPEALPLIFEPFFTTKEPGKGTGLGLSTVYGIVRQSGGVVTVESQLGAGTMFTVFLPFQDEEPSIEETKEVELFSGARGWETILLVEDQPEVLALGREVLELAGYKVLTAENGAAALALAEQYPGTIHLVISDIVMPGMDGRDLAERFLSVRPETKILFTSGYAAPAEAGSDFILNGFSYLAKPYSPSLLTEKVRSVLGRSEFYGAALLVVPNRSKRRSLRRAMSGSGFDVNECCKFEAPLAELAAPAIRLVVLDVSGCEAEAAKFCHALLNLSPRPKILALVSTPIQPQDLEYPWDLAIPRDLEPEQIVEAATGLLKTS